MTRLTRTLLLTALLIGPAHAQTSVVFAQSRPASQATLASLDRVLDSVVSISTVQPSGPAGPSSRGWSPTPGTLLPWLGSGTGFFVSGNEILTSARLVQGNRAVTVKLRGGQTHPATVVGTNTERDLALLRVDTLSPSAARPVTFGNSDRVTAGQRLVALGLTPDGGFTAQEVMVRSVRAGSEELTLDTALNAQARGGPLLNAAGEVVALSTGRFGARLDLPFALGTSGAALPINAARDVLADLRAGRTGPSTQQTRPSVTQRPRLGVQIVDLSDFSARSLRDANLPSEGVLIQDVMAGSPAARAGLRAGTSVRRVGNATLRVGGDVIVAVNGRRVRSAEELQQLIGAAGLTVELEVVRDGQSRRVTVTLDSATGTLS